jgi:uncharacterized protein with HEPN domain
VQEKYEARPLRDFESDWELKFIIQRAIDIISEASRRIPDELKATRPEIEWRSIASIGNFLRHEYHSISDKVIWDVVQVDLPDLKIAIDAIAAALNDKGA